MGSGLYWTVQIYNVIAGPAYCVPTRGWSSIRKILSSGGFHTYTLGIQQALVPTVHVQKTTGGTLGHFLG